MHTSRVGRFQSLKFIVESEFVTFLGKFYCFVFDNKVLNFVIFVASRSIQISYIFHFFESIPSLIIG